MDQQPTPSVTERQAPAEITLSNLQDRHEIGAQIARQLLAESAPRQPALRPLGSLIFDLLDELPPPSVRLCRHCGITAAEASQMSEPRCPVNDFHSYLNVPSEYEVI